MSGIDFEALLKKQDDLANAGHVKPVDPGGVSTNTDTTPNMKHMTKQQRIDLVAHQLDDKEAKDIADKARLEKEKEEADAKAKLDGSNKKKTFFPFINGKQRSREQILYDMWCGRGGNMDLFNILEYLEIKTWSERRHWFFFWLDISGGEKSKGVNFDRFTKFFNMDKGDISKRVFEIINHNLSGYVSFAEFLRFCAQYLVLDKRLTEEFSYRILLRRPSAFKRAHSILDLEDLKFLLTYRYNFKSIGHRNRRAMDLFRFVDADGDGGLDVYEFHDFCKKNTCIVSFGVQIIQHLRRCTFGIKYWVEKSRRLAKIHSGILSSVTPLSRMNIKTETYYTQIGEPVVDSWNNPLTSPLDEQLLFYREEVNDNRTPEELAKLAAYGIKLRERPEKPSFSGSGMKRLEFAKDFPEVEIARLARKAEKQKEKGQLLQVADGLAVRTYDLMLRVCGDLINGRRPLRMAFNKWLDSVDMRDKGTGVFGGSIAGSRINSQGNSKAGSRVVSRKNSAVMDMISEEPGVPGVGEAGGALAVSGVIKPKKTSPFSSPFGSPFGSPKGSPKKVADGSPGETPADSFKEQQEQKRKELLLAQLGPKSILDRALEDLDNPDAFVPTETIHSV